MPNNEGLRLRRTQPEGQLIEQGDGIVPVAGPLMPDEAFV